MLYKRNRYVSSHEQLYIREMKKTVSSAVSRNTKIRSKCSVFTRDIQYPTEVWHDLMASGNVWRGYSSDESRSLSVKAVGDRGR